MSDIKVLFKTQRIIVNPSNSSVSVINAGPIGPQGKQGVGLSIKGSAFYAVINAIPAPKIGDIWIQSDSGGGGVPGDGRMWNGTTWFNLGPSRGPEGLQGPQGNPGPQGIVGPKGEIGNRYQQFVQDDPPVAEATGDQWFNTRTGREYVWYDNFWVEIGTSFQGNAVTVDGNLATRIAGVPGQITRSALANDVAFTSKYSSVINHGSVASTARSGAAPILWIGSVNPTNATDNDALYRTDNTGLFILVSGIWAEAGSSRYVPVPTPWTICTFLNGWNNPGFNKLSYRKIGDIVYLRGAAVGGPATSVVTNLPIGFRPVVEATLAMLVQGGLLGYSRMKSSGDLEHNGANSGGTEWSTYFSILA